MIEGLLIGDQVGVLTVAELDEAKRLWVDPDNNFIMADTSGNIGYLTRGQIPTRPMANAWLPVPGWTGEFEWQGTVPFEEMPRAHNPEQGFIATANQRIVAPDFAHHVSLDYAPPHRAARVNANLAEAQKQQESAINRWEGEGGSMDTTSRQHAAAASVQWVERSNETREAR